jgi:cell division protein FtsQ
MPIEGTRVRGERASDSTPPSAPPPASRMTLRPRGNRRRPAPPGSLWSRVPRPRSIVDACGRALRRSLPALAAAAILSAIGGTAYAGYHFVTTSPRFAITQITVQGNRHLSADQIRAMLPLAIGDNVFAADLDGATRALRTSPWLVRAEVHRILPHTIVVDVGEREPAALVELGGLYLVDASGHPFKRATLEEDDGVGLPVITGLDREVYLATPELTASSARDALAALDRWRSDPSRPVIGELHFGAHGELELHTYDLAIAIELGPLDPGLPARLASFDAAWAELADGERAHLRAIHLDPDHVTVAFKDP